MKPQFPVYIITETHTPGRFFKLRVVPQAEGESKTIVPLFESPIDAEHYGIVKGGTDATIHEVLTPRNLYLAIGGSIPHPDWILGFGCQISSSGLCYRECVSAGDFFRVVKAQLDQEEQL